MDGDRVTVQEAACELGVKDDAIRKRIQRGTLEHEKGSDGRVYVYLDVSRAASQDAHDNAATQDAFLVSLQDQVEDLRSVLQEERDARRRADMIIAQLSQANASLAARVPELEALQAGAPQAGEGADQGSATGTPGSRTPVDDGAPQSRSERRSWWREFFGF
jgi:predicted ArsR family transcriptional regulator